jgi:hypothetical protein
MAESPKEYDVNSYGVYDLAIFDRLHRLFLSIFKVHIKIYVISNSLQLMVMIACVVIKMISRL